MLFCVIAAAGGIGAVCRLLLDSLVRARIRSALPMGTIMVNLLGSLLAGLVAGVAATVLLADDVRAVVTAGFLGGFTTFSTAMFETVRLLQERQTWRALVNGALILAAAIAAAATGIWLGELLGRD